MKPNQSLQIHQCRSNCGACCIAPSISSPIPSMPNGKPVNVRCVNLSDDLLCNIFNHPNRPKVCENFKFDKLICGKNQEEAMKIMNELESITNLKL